MSDIEIGSEWIDDRDGDILKILVVDGIVLRAESKDEGLCTVLANDLLRNYRLKIKEDESLPDFWKDGPGYCRQCKKSLMDKDITYSDRLSPKMRLCPICLTYRRQERDLNADDLSDLSGALGE